MALKLNWTRDPNVSYPNTWQSFKAKGPNTDELREYVIKDVTEDHFDEIFDLFVKSYAVAEPIAVVTNMATSVDLCEWYKKVAYNSMKQKMTIGIFDTVANKFVAANFLWVISKEDEDVTSQLFRLPLPENLKIIFDALGVLCKDLDLFAKYNVDRYLGCFGIAVHKEYTQRGFCTKLLNARKVIGETFGLKVTHSGFSSRFSNRAAEAVGFKVDCEMPFAELAEVDAKFKIFKEIPELHRIITAKTWVF